MSELRDELETAFGSAEQQIDTETGNVTGEQTTNPETAAPDEWMDAPKAYTKEFQESFKALSPEWRKYLIGREKQTEKGFSDLGTKISSYKWVDDAFANRKDRLSQLGFKNSREYIERLASIDDALDKDPMGALSVLAEAYGVDFNNNEQVSNSLQKQINDVQQMLANQQAYIKDQQASRAKQALDDFVSAKDDSGSLKHPYLEEVRADMVPLLENGISQTLEDAYERAIWSNKAVRDKIIAAQAKAEIDAKAAEAAKAKDAGFTPRGKQTTVPEKEMTLREELESRFNALEE